jgi:hypothetical protein
VACDVAGLVVGASGATVVAFFGKLAAAVVLGAVALGFFLRLSSRRRTEASAPRVSVPVWLRVLAAGVSGVLVAALVEATDLPVRFHQPGFDAWHWAVVIVALVVAYSLVSRAAVRLLERGGRRAPQS